MSKKKIKEICPHCGHNFKTDNSMGFLTHYIECECGKSFLARACILFKFPKMKNDKIKEIQLNEYKRMNKNKQFPLVEVIRLSKLADKMIKLLPKCDIRDSRFPYTYAYDYLRGYYTNSRSDMSKLFRNIKEKYGEEEADSRLQLAAKLQILKDNVIEVNVIEGLTGD